MTFALGPVIGQVGGGAEVITEEVIVTGGETRTWTLPDGWESGFIGAQGVLTSSIRFSGISRIFGMRVEHSGATNMTANSFQELDLPAEIFVASSHTRTWEGIITMIRTS